MNKLFATTIGPVREQGESTRNYARRISAFCIRWAIVYFCLEVVIAVALLLIFSGPNLLFWSVVLTLNVAWVLLFFVSFVSALIARWP